MNSSRLARPFAVLGLSTAFALGTLQGALQNTSAPIAAVPVVQAQEEPEYDGDDFSSVDLVLAVSAPPTEGVTGTLYAAVVAHSAAGPHELVLRLPSYYAVADGVPGAYTVQPGGAPHDVHLNYVTWQTDLEIGSPQLFAIDIAPSGEFDDGRHHPIDAYLHPTGAAPTDGDRTLLYVRVGSDDQEPSVSYEWPDGYASLAEDYLDTATDPMGAAAVDSFGNSFPLTIIGPDEVEDEVDEDTPLAVGIELDAAAEPGVPVTVRVRVRNTYTATVAYTGTLGIPEGWALASPSAALDGSLDSGATAEYAIDVIPQLGDCTWWITADLWLPTALVDAGYDDYLIELEGGWFPCGEEAEDPEIESYAALTGGADGADGLPGVQAAEDGLVAPKLGGTNEPTVPPPSPDDTATPESPPTPLDPVVTPETPTAPGPTDEPTPSTPTATPTPGGPPKGYTNRQTRRPSRTPHGGTGFRPGGDGPPCIPCDIEGACPPAVPKSVDTMRVKGKITASGEDAAELRVRILHGRRAPSNSGNRPPRVVAEELALVRTDADGRFDVCVPRHTNVFLEVVATDSLSCSDKDHTWSGWSVQTIIPRSPRVYRAYSNIIRLRPLSDECPFTFDLGTWEVSSNASAQKAEAMFSASMIAHDMRQAMGNANVAGIDIRGNGGYQVKIHFPNNLCGTTSSCVVTNQVIRLNANHGMLGDIQAHEYGHVVHGTQSGHHIYIPGVQLGRRAFLEGFAELFSWTVEDENGFYRGNRCGRCLKPPAGPEARSATGPLDAYEGIGSYFWDVADYRGSHQDPMTPCVGSPVPDDSTVKFKGIFDSFATTPDTTREWAVHWITFAGLTGPALDNFVAITQHHKIYDCGEPFPPVGPPPPPPPPPPPSPPPGTPPPACVGLDPAILAACNGCGLRTVCEHVCSLGAPGWCQALECLCQQGATWACDALCRQGFPPYCSPPPPPPPPVTPTCVP